MNTIMRSFMILLFSGLLIGCGQVIKTEAPVSPPPESPPAPESTEIAPSPTEEPAPTKPAEPVAPYDPSIDLELIAAGLNRAKQSAQGDNFAEMGSELRNISALIGCVESHLPSVVLDVGTQRVLLRLEQNDLEGARRAMAQFVAEANTVSDLSGDSEVQSRLTELTNFLASGDVIKAKEVIGQLSSVEDDPACADIRAMRAALLGAMDAAFRQPPKKRVVLAELETVEELVAKVRQELLESPQAQPTVPGALGQPSPVPPAAGATQPPAAAPQKPPVQQTKPAPSPAGTKRPFRRLFRRRTPTSPSPPPLPGPAEPSASAETAPPAPPTTSTPSPGKSTL